MSILEAGAPAAITTTFLNNTYLRQDQNLSDLLSVPTARTNLGLGTLALQNANAIAVTGGSIVGITDLAIADGGTGQSTAQTAINALSNVLGAANEDVLTKDTATGNAIFKPVVAVIAAAPIDATYITQTPNGTLTNEQALSLLATGIVKNATGTGVLSIALAGTDYLSPAAIGVTIQAWDANLDILRALSFADNNFIVGNGAAWVVESGAIVRTSLGLGTLATFNDAPSDGNQYARKDGAWDQVVGNVSSVFGRTGDVVAVAGDYTGSFITNTPFGGISAVTVQAAIDELDSDKQPLDATLTAFAALVGAADKLPYFTALDVFALADFTPFARTILDDLNQGAVQATLALVPGTNVQVFDVFLTSIASLGTAADKIIYTTAVNVAAETDITAYGRSIIDDANEAAARTTLGLIAGGAGDIWVEKTGDTMTGTLIIDTVGVADQILFQGTSTLRILNFNTVISPSVNTFAIRAVPVFDPQAAALQLTGFNGNARVGGATSTAVSEVRALSGRIQIQDTYSGVITSAIGLLVSNPSNAGSGTPSITNSYGVKVESQTFATNNFAFAGEIVAAANRWNLYMSGTAINYLQGALGIGISAPVTPLDVHFTDTTNTTVVNLVQLTKERTGVTVGGIGMGPGILLRAESATNSTFREQARLFSLWNVATDASRVADVVLTAWYTSESEILRGRGGANPALSFLGAAAIPRPATYTLTGVATRTMPTPPATFTGQDNAQAGAVYAKAADIIALQTQVNNQLGVLRQLIIDLASTSGYGLLVAS